MLRMALLAALAAAVIGPNLPGARSAALVAWHGTAGFGSGTATLAPGGNLPQGIQVSTLVQVAQEEVDDPSVALFTVHSSMPTREMIAALDEFNGNIWSATAAGSPRELGSFSPPLSDDERRPPPATPEGYGREQLVQVFDVSGLGGRDIPSWGSPLAVADAAQLSARSGRADSIVSSIPLRRGSVYAVDSIGADPSSAQLEADSAVTSDVQDLQLPQPVPSRLAQLANSLVAGATTAYGKALDLEAYLTSPKFHYHLPERTKSGVVTPSPGYRGLLSFLFKSRTGYCQQFATAFAVLARIDGLPTRVAIGFLPGAPVAHDQWQVDGIDTHAWPQVQFKNYGWIDFEPTPGTSVRGSSAPVLPTAATTTTFPLVSPTSSGSAHNLRPSPGGAGGEPKPGRRWYQARMSGSLPALWLLVLPAGAALLGWGPSVVETAAVATLAARIAHGDSSRRGVWPSRRSILPAYVAVGTRPTSSSRRVSARPECCPTRQGLPSTTSLGSRRLPPTPDRRLGTSELVRRRVMPRRLFAVPGGGLPVGSELRWRSTREAF